VAECRDTGSRLTEYLLLGERVLATALAVLSLATTLAINYKKSYLLMGLPLAFAIAVLYVIYLNTEAISLGGYKAALEDEITRRLGHPVTFWESRIARMRHHSIPNYSMRVVTCLFFLGSIIVALAQAFATQSRSHFGHQYAALYIGGTITSIIVSVTAIIVSFILEMKSHSQVESLTRAVLSEYRTTDVK
jgi:hypothetical protein